MAFTTSRGSVAGSPAVGPEYPHDIKGWELWAKNSLINPYKKVFCANHLINWALLFSAFPSNCFVIIEDHIWKIPPFHYTFDVSKDIRLVQDHWHHCSLQHLAASSCPSSTVPLLRRRLDLHGPPSQTAMALLTVRRQLAAGAEVPAVSMGQSQVQEVFLVGGDGMKLALYHFGK